MREGTPTAEQLSAGTHVVEFSAPWCGPCRTFAPKYEEIADRGEYADKHFWNVDVSSEDGQVVARDYSIRSVPTIVVFVDGAVTEIIVGGDVTESKLVGILNRI